MDKKNIDNFSGLGKTFEVPSELIKWNWGAFWFTWIWGFFNNSFVSLLVFVPGFNLAIPFYLGIHGNEMAWRNKKWKNEEVFLKVQKRWIQAGWVAAVVYIVVVGLATYNITSVVLQEKYIKDEVCEMISESEAATHFIGDDFEIDRYIRGSAFIFWDTTHSIVVKSSRGKYWAAIRLDENGKVYEVLLSHYYLIDGYQEVLIKRQE